MTEPRTLKEVEQELAEIYERTFVIYKELKVAQETGFPDTVPFGKIREGISAIQMMAIRLRNGK